MIVSIVFLLLSINAFAFQLELSGVESYQDVDTFQKFVRVKLAQNATMVKTFVERGKAGYRIDTDMQSVRAMLEGEKINNKSVFILEQGDDEWLKVKLNP